MARTVDSPAESVISVRDLTFSYPGTAAPILRNVNLEVGRGEFIALLGSNGAGKTTLAKHFNGLHTPTSGQVLLHGRPTAELGLRELARVVGYCYQNPDHQIFSSSVENEVKFGPRNLGLTGDVLASRVSEALAVVGLTEFAASNPFVLGRGRRQLLAVASILAMNPELLVVDEPTTGLDLSGAQQIMRVLNRWHEEGRTMIVITHDMDLVIEYTTRCVVMADGRIIDDGPTQEVLRHYDTMRAAGLEEPAVVTISDRLSRFGSAQCKSIADVVTDVAARMEAEHAGRI